MTDDLMATEGPFRDGVLVRLSQEKPVSNVIQLKGARGGGGWGIPMRFAEKKKKKKKNSLGGGGGAESEVKGGVL